MITNYIYRSKLTTCPNELNLHDFHLYLIHILRFFNAVFRYRTGKCFKSCNTLTFLVKSKQKNHIKRSDKAEKLP